MSITALPKFAPIHMSGVGPGPSLAGEIRVHVADDDEQFSVVVRDLLQSQPGFKLVGFSSSVEATLSGLASTPADVLVLDLYMPEGESLECIADARRLLPGIRVLVTTGGGWADQQVASILAGANGFLYKPFTSSDLTNSIRLIYSGKAFFDLAAVTAALNAPAVPHSVPEEPLSPEDLEFLGLLRRGLSNTEIATMWNTGIKAVYQRRFRLKTKLGLHCARDLTGFA